MRGAHSAKTKIAQDLNELHKEELHRKGFDEITRLLTEKGFQNCSKSEDKLHEEQYQARMINYMGSNKALKSFLKVDNLFLLLQNLSCTQNVIKANVKR